MFSGRCIRCSLDQGHLELFWVVWAYTLWIGVFPEWKSRFGSPTPALVVPWCGLLYCLQLDCPLKRTWYSSFNLGAGVGRPGLLQLVRKETRGLTFTEYLLLCQKLHNEGSIATGKLGEVFPPTVCLAWNFTCSLKANFIWLLQETNHFLLVIWTKWKKRVILHWKFTDGPCLLRHNILIRNICRM